MNRSKKRKLLAQSAKIAERARSATGRTCGECSACCVRLRIDELNKDQEVRCRYLASGGGCSIYEKRPSSCRAFLCGWLLGWGDEEDRPDKSGVLLAIPGRSPQQRLWRLLSIDGTDVRDNPVAKKLRAAITQKQTRLYPGVPVGFFVDMGNKQAQFEIPRGAEGYFAEELRRQAALPVAPKGE